MNVIEYWAHQEISPAGKLYIGLFAAAVVLAIVFKIYGKVVEKREKAEKEEKEDK